MILKGENQSSWEKTCPSATLSATNPTWTDTASNPGIRGFMCLAGQRTGADVSVY
jgi:hypothetical protein